MDKRQKIERQLEMIEEYLAAAEEYVARNVNVEGSSFLHFGDWKGKSGHPLWMKNHMIPATKKGRARKEKALEMIIRKSKEKGLKQRGRPRAGA
jgi:hypothetical protein